MFFKLKWRGQVGMAGIYLNFKADLLVYKLFEAQVSFNKKQIAKIFSIQQVEYQEPHQDNPKITTEEQCSQYPKPLKWQIKKNKKMAGKFFLPATALGTLRSAP